MASFSLLSGVSEVISPLGLIPAIWHRFQRLYHRHVFPVFPPKERIWGNTDASPFDRVTRDNRRNDRPSDSNALAVGKIFSEAV